jgi:branched-chain amino acid aminotransferase
MAAFPPPPVSTIDWSNVGFKVREVNGHIHSTFSYSSPNPSWTKPQFVASPYLSIHGMAPALNYGVQSYEGMKAFRTSSGSITIFRPDQNAKRMMHSAEYISVPLVPEEHFIECVRLAVAMNAEYVPPHETGAAMYIRPLLFGSSAQLGLNPPDEYTFVVFVMPTGVYHGVHAVDCLILEDFDRAAPEGTGSAKIGGNYAPVLRHSERARQKGYGITLHLDSKTRTEIDEFSTSGFIGVRQDGETATLVVPDSKNAIKSVTSESTCQIGRDLFGFKVEKRRILYEELKDFKEVMAAGTAASLVPIKSITRGSEKFEYPVTENGEPGPVCTKLLTTLKGLQQGRIKDTFGWNFEVTAASPKDFAGDAVNGVNGDVHPHKIDELP